MKMTDIKKHAELFEGNISKALWDLYSTGIPEDSGGGAEDIAEMVAGKSVIYESDFIKATEQFSTRIKELEKLVDSAFVAGRSKMSFEQFKIASQFSEPEGKEAVELNGKMSRQYRLMIYFAVAEIMFYAKDLVDRVGMTVQEFRDKNEAVLKRVFDEGMSIMNYELSTHQMDRAVAAYLSGKYNPQSILNTLVYKITL